MASTNSPKNMPQEVILPTKIVQDIQDARILTKKSLEKQAAKMLALSSVKYPAANVGDNVVVKIPDVDRAKANDRNIIAVTMAVEKERMYWLCTKHGILKQIYARNLFKHCKEKFISASKVRDEHVSVRECARKYSHL